MASANKKKKKMGKLAGKMATHMCVHPHTHTHRHAQTNAYIDTNKLPSFACVNFCTFCANANCVKRK